MALPGQGKNFQAFQQDDVACRQYASQQTGGASPGVAATNSAVGSAVVGTALGAAAGAAIGSVGGAAGAGAAIGGATGLLAGSAIGANNAAAAYGGVQQAYDVGYTQCMTAHGDTVQAPPTGYAAYPYPLFLPLPLPRLPIRLCVSRLLRSTVRRALSRRRIWRRLGLGRRGMAWWRLGLAVVVGGTTDPLTGGSDWPRPDHDISRVRSAAMCAPSSSASIGAMNLPSGPIKYSTELWSIA